MGGFADETVKSTFLFLLYSFDNSKILLHLLRNVLAIKIASSLLKLFSIKMLIVLRLFLIRQLSISSEIL